VLILPSRVPELSRSKRRTATTSATLKFPLLYRKMKGRNHASLLLWISLVCEPGPWFESTVIVTASTPPSSSFSPSGSSPLSEVLQTLSRRSHSTLTQSVPALSVFHVQSKQGSSKNRGNRWRDPWHRDSHRQLEMIEVSTKQKRRETPTSQTQQQQRQRRGLSFPSIDKNHLQQQMGGLYYGISLDSLNKATNNNDNSVSVRRKRPNLSDSMDEALEELRGMRIEMEMMRKEMQSLKRKMITMNGEEGDSEEDKEEVKAQARLAQRRKAKECEKLAAEIEEWAMKILEETEEDGWKEVTCNKMMRGSLNPTERTKAYLKVGDLFY